MTNAIRWLRISYWVGAILDAYSAIRLTQTFLESLNAQNFHPEYGSAAALMWGWTFLLLWADRQPLERKGVILLTAIPVVVLLATSNAAGLVVGYSDQRFLLLSLPIQATITTLFLYSYWNASRAEKRETAT
jgi:hypothetical protein